MGKGPESACLFKKIKITRSFCSMSQDSQGVDNVNLVLLSLVQQYLISKTYGTQDEDKMCMML
jgi:hypothetical protein